MLAKRLCWVLSDTYITMWFFATVARMDLLHIGCNGAGHPHVISRHSSLMAPHGSRGEDLQTSSQHVHHPVRENTRAGWLSIKISVFAGLIFKLLTQPLLPLLLPHTAAGCNNSSRLSATPLHSGMVFWLVHFGCCRCYDWTWADVETRSATLHLPLTLDVAPLTYPNRRSAGSDSVIRTANLLHHHVTSHHIFSLSHGTHTHDTQ